MRKPALVFGYFLIYTTPIQVFILFLIFYFAWISPRALLEISSGHFLLENLPTLYHWIYSWFWNALLDFFWQFPAVLVVSGKILFNTWLGMYLVKRTKKAKPTNKHA